MSESFSALPHNFRDVEHLEQVMTTPSAALVGELAVIPGDWLFPP